MRKAGKMYSRLQKGLLDGIDADILLIYSSREVMSSSEIYKRVGELLDRLARNCSKANGEEQL